jgi:hypothetical protein
VVSANQISLQLLDFQFEHGAFERQFLDVQLELRALQAELLLAEFVEFGGADVGDVDDRTGHSHRPRVGSAAASSLAAFRRRIACPWIVVVQLVKNDAY